MLRQWMLLTNCHEVNAFIVIQTVLPRRLESRLTFACTNACMSVCCNWCCYFAMDICLLEDTTAFLCRYACWIESHAILLCGYIHSIQVTSSNFINPMTNSKFTQSLCWHCIHACSTWFSGPLDWKCYIVNIRVSLKWLPLAMVCTTGRDGFERPYHSTVCYDMLKSYSNCPNLWSFAAVSCTTCANLYLFPVTLCSFVQQLQVTQRLDNY